jgi:7-carboxy-7-deazaguanine synthase
MHLIQLYKSVQGESSFAGLPCIFVRLAGCNLRCAWCDSEYTFTGGKPFTLDEIEQQIEALAPCTLVEFTGGEPMLQERELIPLMQRLLDEDYQLLIETSGERLLANVPKAVHKIVDVKCPHSGAADTFNLSNLDALTDGDEIKFVLSDRTDYDFARDFTREHGLAERVNSVIFSPAFRKDARGARDASHCLLDPQQLAEWILEDGLNVRLGLQIHKFIWQPETKGV